MIGRFSEWRPASSNPAATNAAYVPVQANTAGMASELGITGYPSTIRAPCLRANRTAYENNQ